MDKRRGTSPTISFVLSVAVLLTLTATTYYWATESIQGLGEQGRVKSYYNQMASLSGIIKEVGRGDENFTTLYTFYYPTEEYVSPFLQIDEEKDLIKLTFVQNAYVLGYVGTEPANETCGNDYLLDNDTSITLYRVNEYDTVYQGALGPGEGAVEIATCFTGINITWDGRCSAGRTGPNAYIKIRKANVTNGKPVVALDIC